MIRDFLEQENHLFLYTLDSGSSNHTSSKDKRNKNITATTVCNMEKIGSYVFVQDKEMKKRFLSPKDTSAWPKMQHVLTLCLQVW